MITDEVLVSVDINQITFDIDEEVLVQIEFSIHGKDIPASFDDPAEHAELDVEEVIIIAATLDGEVIELTTEQKAEVIKLLDKERIAALCWKEAERQKQADDDDFDIPDDFDDWM